MGWRTPQTSISLPSGAKSGPDPVAPAFVTPLCRPAWAFRSRLLCDREGAAKACARDKKRRRRMGAMFAQIPLGGTSGDGRPSHARVGSGAAKQVCDYFGRALVAARGELLQPLGILILDADDDCQLASGLPTWASSSAGRSRSGQRRSRRTGDRDLSMDHGPCSSP